LQAAKAWNVPSEFGESKAISVGVYNIAVIGAVSYFLAGFLGSSNASIGVLLRCIGISLAATLAVALIMTPKMLLIEGVVNMATLKRLGFIRSSEIVSSTTEKATKAELPSMARMFTYFKPDAAHAPPARQPRSDLESGSRQSSFMAYFRRSTANLENLNLEESINQFARRQSVQFESTRLSSNNQAAANIDSSKHNSARMNLNLNLGSSKHNNSARVKSSRINSSRINSARINSTSGKLTPRGAPSVFESSGP
jgi:hypothetical protein